MNRKFRGFTLLEVLIATVILSVGVLSVAALQLKALRQNSGNYARSQAIFLAYDMADRMRANVLGVNSGAYNQTVPDDVQNCDGTSCDCDGDAGVDLASANDCSVNELAQWDIFTWNADLTNPAIIPGGGDGEIACTGCPACACNVTVNWQNLSPSQNEPDDTDPQSITFGFRL